MLKLNTDIIITICLLFFLQIIVWFQLNGQLIWQWCKDNPLILSLLGVPLSYGFFMSTTYGYRGFGELWPIRLMGFATGMISFPFITYLLLGEGITVKTGISIVLAAVIMVLQLTK
tara:strand:- start:141 stop:488 length:348 start_codon:yes stop_codon:yes gene_type:complete